MKTKFSYNWCRKKFLNVHTCPNNDINVEINSDYFIGTKKVEEILKEIFPKNFFYQPLDDNCIEKKLIEGVDSAFQKLESPNGSLEIIMKVQLCFVNCTYTKSSEPKDYITR